ncbi:hypothetical protein EMCG_06222 [[Emmonsia] crescens]|uniref:Uncharacterized protein n=1 Tax=[Emmonsia] crescens TaxID=73230 RepID=A0A0G2IBS1_9EURO|nr:hypothetical protein EMCG_06222 [Emmonsia crescens UAMH 3008]
MCTDKSDELQDQRKELYKHEEHLLARELDRWQMHLPRERKPGATAEDDYTLSYHWTWFDRVSHLMPERKRLRSLFLHVPLRSPEGRQAIEDKIKICRQKSPVSDHPALRSNNGCCPVAECSVILIMNLWAQPNGGGGSSISVSSAAYAKNMASQLFFLSVMSG